MKTRRGEFMVLAGGMALLLGVALHLWASSAEAAAQTCRKGFFPASGQTQAFAADLNDGIAADVPVPDDGAIQAGKPLSYQDNGNGTITDLNTGLMWEKKDMAGGLHDWGNTYVWSGTGMGEETIWDWLADVNAEAGGIGFAGYTDWRIPNVRELQSIVDYGRSNPSIDPAFGATTATFYWSSTTVTNFPANAWVVSFGNGFMPSNPKSGGLGNLVRAVRGGCVD